MPYRPCYRNPVLLHAVPGCVSAQRRPAPRRVSLGICPTTALEPETVAAAAGAEDACPLRFRRRLFVPV